MGGGGRSGSGEGAQFTDTRGYPTRLAGEEAAAVTVPGCGDHGGMLRVSEPLDKRILFLAVSERMDNP